MSSISKKTMKKLINNDESDPTICFDGEVPCPI